MSIRLVGSVGEIQGTLRTGSGAETVHGSRIPSTFPRAAFSSATEADHELSTDVDHDGERKDAAIT